MMPFAFQGEILRSQLDIKLRRSGERSELEIWVWESSSQGCNVKPRDSAWTSGEGGGVGRKEIKIKEKIEIKCPGELPSLEVDEMSKGNREGVTSIKKTRRGWCSRSRVKTVFGGGSEQLCPMRLRGPGSWQQNWPLDSENLEETGDADKCNWGDWWR